MTPDTLGLTAEGCMALLDAGDVSCVELVDAYLARIEQQDGDLNCYLRTRTDAAREEAARFDREGRSGLQGVPIALKDILCVRGEETTAGSRILEGHRPLYDAGVVTRARAAGLIPLGKTNMDEFAMGSSTEHSAFGTTHNPWDARMVPGGSQRRLGGGRGRWAGTARAGHRHRRLDPAAGGALRGGRHEAHVRRRLAPRPDRLRQLARPDRPVRARRSATQHWRCR